MTAAARPDKPPATAQSGVRNRDKPLVGSANRMPAAIQAPALIQAALQPGRGRLPAAIRIPIQPPAAAETRAAGIVIQSARRSWSRRMDGEESQLKKWTSIGL